jgi:hypothetical protein
MVVLSLFFMCLEIATHLKKKKHWLEKFTKKVILRIFGPNKK